MSLQVLTQGGGTGGASASIFVTGLTENDEVKAVQKIPCQVLNPEWVVPEGYTQLTYIEATGSQYIDLNLIPSNHYTEVKFDCVEYNNDEHIFGTSGTNNGTYYHFTTYNNKYYWGLNGTEASGGSWSTGIKTLKYNYGDNYQVILDNVVLGSGSAIAGSNSMVLFSRGGTTNFIGRLYFCKVIDKSINEVVRHLIPCYRNSDNTIGLYDLVTNTFYTNAGTGTFITGEEIPQYIEGYIDGKTVNSKWEERVVYELQPLIPTMTSDTAPSGVASQMNTVQAGFEAYMAFRNKISTSSADCAQSTYGTSLPWHIGYEFPEEKEISYFMAYFSHTDSSYHKSSTGYISVSNNGETWEKVADFSNLAAATTHTITLESPVRCKYFRFYFTSYNNSYNTQSVRVGMIQAYGLVPIVTNGHIIGSIKDYGTWTVTATDGDNIDTQDVMVDIVTEYKIKMSYREKRPENTNLLMHFDETLEDETEINAPKVHGTESYGDGKFGKAFVFSGSNAVVMDNTNFTFGSDDFTVAAWIYPTSTTTAHYSEILSRCCYYSSSYTCSGFNLWILGTSGNERKIHTNVYTSYSSSASVTSTKQVELNAWTHVALVRSGTTLKLYINGVLDGSTTISGSVYSGGTVRPIMIGARSSAANSTPSTDWFFGRIDEVIIAKEAIWTENFDPPVIEYK